MNPHEDAARWRKVALMLAEMVRHGIERSAVELFGEREWALIATAAGVKPPSTDTIIRLLDTLGGVPEGARP